ncbi:hypothetical protein A4H97_28175 [Niastella yeongjuensis]|uniref:Uncharacterized protein n=1 Tax=Niastella yeongjuensis TaxID=354355 RepID=A0A1V9EUE7_9BACT|nr:hypothetical protein [Niastella yeongjuensis]OQP49770.1 hypothetical protein A4H97_28175 [Niastella yeongjuensis]SEP40469.1 hypothetical protein SAMN05660816_05800 [Niastella yeongjuensis]
MKAKRIITIVVTALAVGLVVLSGSMKLMGANALLPIALIWVAALLRDKSIYGFSPTPAAWLYTKAG